MDSKEWFYSLATCGRPLNDTVKHADNISCLAVSKILPVVKNQHLLLCTLLIGNSLAIESLPIFLDKLVPSWSAILVSVTLILMFGEIIPQVICTHYGLTIGATVAPLVQLLLWLFFPIAYPISKALDWMLGKGYTALLQRAELKTFVDFHGNEAGKGRDLTHDETTIITGALELMEKTTKDAITPISKAFSLDLDGTLNLWIYKLMFNFIQAFTNFLFLVYVPREKSELGHWILGVFDFIDWCIYVYDSNCTRRSDKVVQKVMLPYQNIDTVFF
ncbi:DUF21 domain-containing protein [Capsicum chinense]|nr:DUF21 domain-containing protein [Capsicum chinense]